MAGASRAGEVDDERAEEALADLIDFDLRRHPHVDLLPRAWELRDDLTAYDAMYIALAEALDGPLVTRDRRHVHDSSVPGGMPAPARNRTAQDQVDAMSLAGVAMPEIGLGRQAEPGSGVAPPVDSCFASEGHELATPAFSLGRRPERREDWLLSYLDGQRAKPAVSCAETATAVSARRGSVHWSRRPPGTSRRPGAAAF